MMIPLKIRRVLRYVFINRFSDINAKEMVTRKCVMHAEASCILLPEQ